MDSQIIGFLVIVLGALAGVLTPYLLKAKEEGLPFNMSYIYGMVLTLAIGAFAVLPNEVELAFKPLFGLFLAGTALQVAANKVNTIRIKGKS